VLETRDVIVGVRGQAAPPLVAHLVDTIDIAGNGRGHVATLEGGVFDEAVLFYRRARRRERSRKGGAGEPGVR
jgi:hypothetical protein